MKGADRYAGAGLAMGLTMKSISTIFALVAVLAGTFGPVRSPQAQEIAAHAKATARYVCSFAPSQNRVVAYIVDRAGGGAAGVRAVLGAAGLTAVTHSSGGTILTGSGGYIAGTLGGAQVGPALVVVGLVVAGVAVSVELLCAPINRPEDVNKVVEVATEFYARSREKLAMVPQKSGEAWRATKEIAAEYRDGSVKWGAEAIEYAKRKSVTVKDAVHAVGE